MRLPCILRGVSGVPIKNGDQSLMTAAKRTTILPPRPADRGVRRATSAGFSLFELLIAMSVIAIIAAVAVPRLCLRRHHRN